MTRNIKYQLVLVIHNKSGNKKIITNIRLNTLQTNNYITLTYLIIPNVLNNRFTLSKKPILFFM